MVLSKPRESLESECREVLYNESREGGNDGDVAGKSMEEVGEFHLSTN